MTKIKKDGSQFYIPELDGLRFVAFLLVFIHNSPYLETSMVWKAVNEYGWIGVDLFFCLSAFLITKLLVLEYKQEGKINIQKFYFRRALRIWPLYFFYITIALIFSVQKQGWDHLPLHFAGLFTFTFNFASILLFPRVIVLFIHLWTISYEEQFYAVIPWFLRRLLNIPEKLKWRVIAILFLIGISIRALFIYFAVKHPAIYMLPFTHFEAMLGGVAIGLGLMDRTLNKIPGWILLILGILCNAFIFLLPNIYEIGWSLLLTYLFSGLGMSLILLSTINKCSKFFSAFLTNKAFRYLGKISYGLYIFHILSNFLAIQIINAFPNHTIAFSIIVFLLGFTLTILLASISFYLIEKPFLKWKERFGLITSHPI